MGYFDNTFPPLKFSYNTEQLPSEKECYMLWDKYEMLPNIREHSQLVAEFARGLAILINRKYPNSVSENGAYVAGLLHDIAKTWTIKHGGNHQILGASIVRLETRSTFLASCVYHHVIWAWQEGELSQENMAFHIPLLITYADKRVRHNELVTLEDRFEDLQERYGTTEERKDNIQINYNTAKQMEDILSKKLEFNLNECTLDSGLLVARA